MFRTIYSACSQPLSVSGAHLFHRQSEVVPFHGDKALYMFKFALIFLQTQKYFEAVILL